jgi:DNA (cytosine-5)-methyltransferase 1
MRTINIGSDFSGVGAFDYAIGRVATAKGFKVNTVFACDMDKFARQTYIHNHGEPCYYPENVYNRAIPETALDVYMTSPPCQAFSMAGKRLGKQDKRGILFFNSLEFIEKNQPRYFIFENVKGLISHENGKTFSEWVNLLGGKSVNGLPVIFPYENAVNYHIYFDVLNAKEHGIPQNRERVFIIGIRDDQDNNFRFPKTEYLSKRLVDILENEVDKKYFLSEKIVNGFLKHNDIHNLKKTGFIFNPKNKFDIANALRANSSICPADNAIQIKSATSNGYELAEIGDSINYQNTESKTRRGRVGKQVAQTIDTTAQQAVVIKIGEINESQSTRVYSSNGIAVSQMACGGGMGAKTGLYEIKERIRRLTPRECFRLMDFPDSFTWPVSDSQAYKQAGNSIVVRVLEKIIANLRL